MSNQLVLALMNQKNARRWIKQVGGDAIPTGLYKGIRCTLPSLVSKWMGYQNSSPEAFLKNKDQLRRLGIYEVDTYEKAIPILQSLGLEPSSYVGTYNSGGHLTFIPYKTILAIVLMSNSTKSKELRTLMGVEKFATLEELYAAANVSYFYNPVKSQSVVKAVSNGKGTNTSLLQLLTDPNKILKAKSELEPKLKTLEDSISALSKERDEVRGLLDKLNVLAG